MIKHLKKHLWNYTDKYECRKFFSLHFYISYYRLVSYLQSTTVHLSNKPLDWCSRDINASRVLLAVLLALYKGNSTLWLQLNSGIVIVTWNILANSNEPTRRVIHEFSSCSICHTKQLLMVVRISIDTIEMKVNRCRDKDIVHTSIILQDIQ